MMTPEEKPMTPDEESEIRRVVECDWKHRSERWACLLLLNTLDSLRAALAARDAELTRLREAAEKAWKVADDERYDAGRYATYDAAQGIGNIIAAIAALLPPTPKEG